MRGYAQRLEVLHESLHALQGVTGLWSLTLSDDPDCQAYVVASFAQSTRVMAVGTPTSPCCLAGGMLVWVEEGTHVGHLVGRTSHASMSVCPISSTTADTRGLLSLQAEPACSLLVQAPANCAWWGTLLDGWSAGAAQTMLAPLARVCHEPLYACNIGMTACTGASITACQ